MGQIRYDCQPWCEYYWGQWDNDLCRACTLYTMRQCIKITCLEEECIYCQSEEWRSDQITNKFRRSKRAAREQCNKYEAKGLITPRDFHAKRKYKEEQALLNHRASRRESQDTSYSEDGYGPQPIHYSHVLGSRGNDTQSSRNYQRSSRMTGSSRRDEYQQTFVSSEEYDQSTSRSDGIPYRCTTSVPDDSELRYRSSQQPGSRADGYESREYGQEAQWQGRTHIECESGDVNKNGTSKRCPEPEAKKEPAYTVEDLSSSESESDD